MNSHLAENGIAGWGAKKNNWTPSGFQEKLYVQASNEVESHKIDYCLVENHEKRLTTKQTFVDSTEDIKEYLQASGLWHQSWC